MKICGYTHVCIMVQTYSSLSPSISVSFSAFSFAYKKKSQYTTWTHYKYIMTQNLAVNAKSFHTANTAVTLLRFANPNLKQKLGNLPMSLSLHTPQCHKSYSTSRNTVLWPYKFHHYIVASHPAYCEFILHRYLHQKPPQSIPICTECYM